MSSKNICKIKNCWRRLKSQSKITDEKSKITDEKSKITGEKSKIAVAKISKLNFKIKVGLQNRKKSMVQAQKTFAKSKMHAKQRSQSKTHATPACCSSTSPCGQVWDSLECCKVVQNGRDCLR